MGVLVNPINKTVAFLTSPLSLALALVVLALVCAVVGRRRLALACGGLSLGMLLVFSSGLTALVLGGYLEDMYPPRKAEELPKADAIVVLGGGVGANVHHCPYAELFAGADRVWHAARLWKAGKAPLVIVSGTNEVNASACFLRDLGVPDAAVRVENRSLNTEENARFVCDCLRAAQAGERAERPRVLLVTSAWHMRRALLLFGKYAPGLTLVPAAADHEATASRRAPDERWNPSVLLPSAQALAQNSAYIKEIVGYWGYRLLR